jgi:uncharacterized protein YyaL (SSP411 family)
MPEHVHTNRLIHESSPYLLQHAHNPVDWYPWGEEAIEKARTEDKPILLSVGYSACHWCHVMERESFENEAIAERMNELFVNIKVDREERPDIDAIYMDAVQLLAGQGGWPMTLFLTPTGEPFFGGTYFPPDDRFGRPGFARVIEAVSHAWRTQRKGIVEQGADMVRHLRQFAVEGATGQDVVLTYQTIDRAYQQIASQYDSQYGGFSPAPKFPQPANLEFLLHYHHYSQQPKSIEMIERTLQRMALGGIYDQLGSGFHRYSTDAVWLAPHFEKMLYDNAQLAQVYAHAFQATGRAFYKGIAEETLDYLVREMRHPQGGFYSAQDADSEGEEGKFFVWSRRQIRELLSERDAEVFCAFFDVTDRGNWEGKNILRVVGDVTRIAEQHGLTEDEVAEILDSARNLLLAEREKRVHPALDDKVLTSWNGMVLAAFAECAAIFDRQDFANVAVENAEFLLSTMSYTDVSGHLRLKHTWREGDAKVNGFLEDYACLADGLLRLFEVTFDTRWLTTAEQLAATVLELFIDPRDGGFFSTSVDHEALLTRPKSWDDNATPSGNSVFVDILLRLSHLTGKSAYQDAAATVLRHVSSLLERHPYSFGRALSALDFYLASPREIVIIGPSSDARTRELARTVFSRYLPNKVVLHSEDGDFETGSSLLLEGKHMIDGVPTAYVCSNFTCKQPVTSAADLAGQL